MQAILSIGTNLGDKAENLDNAVDMLSEIGKISGISKIYQTVPWGFESHNMFFNIIVVMDTGLKPVELLEATQEIERCLGRKSKTKNGYADRVIDIDIVDYNSEIITTPRLSLPHPNMHRRNFVLYPLADILPGWIHPVLNITAAGLKEVSSDKDIPEIIS